MVAKVVAAIAKTKCIGSRNPKIIEIAFTILACDITSFSLHLQKITRTKHEFLDCEIIVMLYSYGIIMAL